LAERDAEWLAIFDRSGEERLSALFVVLVIISSIRARMRKTPEKREKYASEECIDSLTLASLLKLTKSCSTLGLHSFP
jgi:hypothetical protein